MVKHTQFEKEVSRPFLCRWALKCLHMQHKEQIMKLTLPEPPLETSKQIILYFLNGLHLKFMTFPTCYINRKLINRKGIK